ncbi:MAG: tRNA (guanine(26)-N(2))-dimethyltransferase [Halobacteriales archaeon]|nr:tRNA (guanine(26)-N(2))-dimethyltransferase [Halobacteriales archaeon]
MNRVREGGVAVRVPEQPEAGAGDAVFFNPEMALNRDVTVAVLRAFREREPAAETYLDANAASGIRGVRAAAEGWDVTAVDVDEAAVELARANFRANDLQASVRRRDANAELHRHRYDVVDVDPFGSPMPFADAAVRGARRLLCVTATDTAPLCGAHFAAGVRRYDAVPRNTEYHREMGLRVLLSALARRAGARDVGLRPLCSHATRHYVRTYLAVEGSATAADEALEALGYLHHCEDCLHRTAEAGRIPRPPASCPACGGERVLSAGPLWLGPVRDREFVAETRRRLTDELDERVAADRLLRRLEGELDVPHHFDQHVLCKAWNRPAGPMDGFLEALGDAGYAASRTHYGGTTFKTDAPVAAVREATA